MAVALLDIQASGRLLICPLMEVNGYVFFFFFLILLRFFTSRHDLALGLRICKWKSFKRKRIRSDEAT